MNENEDINWVQFHDLIVKLRLSLTQELNDGFGAFFDEFCKLNSSWNQIEFCMKNEHVNRSIANVKNEVFKNLSASGKSDEKSKELRLSGNDYFKKGMYLKAVDLYTLALMNATFPANRDSSSGVEAQELGSCFGNRSAALLHLKYYTQAINDINEALKYSECNSTKKLLSRKVECLINLKRKAEAKHILDSNSDLLSDLKVNFEARLNSITTAESKGEDCVTSRQIECKNARISNGSDSIEVEYSEKKGRHIVATKDIGVREALVIEKPYSCYLEHGLFLQNCQHCLKQLEYSGIPCMKCNEVLFCSDTCRSLSKSYHDKECCYCLSTLNSLGISYMVLRTLFTAGVDAILKAVKSRDNENSTELETFYGSNYKAIFKLGDHESEFGAEELLHFTLAALFLLDIYENVLEKKLTAENSLTLCYGIFRHILQLNTNAITIFAQNISNSATNSEVNVEEQRLGIGLYPTIALFNHSCVPNTVAFHCGSQITIETAKKVKAGEEVFYCYGPSVNSMSFKDRQKVLKEQYFFNCDCLGCAQRIENRRRAYLCPKCKGALIINEDLTSECLDCKATDADVNDLMQKAEEGRQLAKEGKELFADEDFDEAVVKLSFSNKIREKCLFRLNDELKDIKSDLCTCVAMLQHFDVAFQYCNQVLTITREVSGEQSVEVAQVMLKMVSLKLRAIEDLREEDDPKAKSEAQSFINFIDNAIEKFDQLSSAASQNNEKSLFTSEMEYLRKNRQLLLSYV